MICNDPAQDPKWCPESTNDALPGVLGLLPHGPAWDGARVEGTAINQYWRALANVLAFTHQRICAYLDEFFCATAKESLDQWKLEYALGEDCDPYGNDLCLKVAARGGATCDYFVDVAERSGYVIACDDLADDPEPIAGCFEVGCTPLGPTPVLYDVVPDIDMSEFCACWYGSIVEHPQPQYWQDTFAHLATCPLPGSSLGTEPSGDESCCFIVGYYESDNAVVPRLPDACIQQGRLYYYGCPPQTAFCRDLDKRIYSYGLAHHWRVTIDMPASEELQGVELVDEDEPISAAGNFEAGCTPLCNEETKFALCFLEKVKPAHTVLITEVVTT